MDDETQTLLGYYRYTDIMFEWYRNLEDKRAASALKAFIAHEALTSPDNPLHPGVQGIDLSLVTIPSGQSRLCFSSAQVEYIRYWIHAMGLSSHQIPLPSSSYLLTPGELKSVSPVKYLTAKDVRYANRDIEKNNKKLKTAPGGLTDLRTQFERCRAFFASRKGTWLAIDFESWERDHKCLTEFGFSLLSWDSEGKEIRREEHWLDREHLTLTNGSYVPENRRGYLHGQSLVFSDTEFKQAVRDLIYGYAQAGPLYIIFHGAAADKIYLQLCDISIPSVAYTLPANPPAEQVSSGETNLEVLPVYVVDTQILFKALEGQAETVRTLERVCRLLKLKGVQGLHNAGNDAHLTLAALESMASGEPLDKQRETRWPANLTPGVPQGVPVPIAQQNANRLAVQFGEEEDSDYSDEYPHVI